MRLVVSILVTITALVLSLLLSEVKGSFDMFDARVRAFAGEITNLGLHLGEYGDEAKPIRAMLREYVAAAIADNWPDETAPSGDYPKFPPSKSPERRELGALLVRIDTAISRLEPPDGFHRRLAQSLSTQIDAVLAARRELLETARDTFSWPLMVAMCGWLAVVFGVFGLLAPRNVVVHLTIVICAFCVASAVFLADDYDSPLDGILHVSSAPMRQTLTQLDDL